MNQLIAIDSQLDQLQPLCSTKWMIPCRSTAGPNSQVTNPLPLPRLRSQFRPLLSKIEKVILSPESNLGTPIQKQNNQNNQQSPLAIKAKARPQPPPQAKQKFIEKVQIINSTHHADSCKNHPDRLADFVINIQGDNLLYCQKCAVLLASQGFNVSKIRTEDSKRASERSVRSVVGRQAQIEALMKVFQKLVAQLSQCSDHIAEQRACIQESVCQQIQETNSYYDSLVKVIQALRKRTLEGIKVSSRKTLNSLSIYQRQLQSDIDDLKLKQSDINDHYKSIVQHVVAEDQYRAIMNAYKTNCEELAEKMQQLANLSIPSSMLLRRPNNQQLERFARSAQEEFELDVVQVPGRADQQYSQQQNEHPDSSPSPQFKVL